MRRIHFIIVLAVLLFSCERSSETEDVIFRFYGDESENTGYSIAKAEDGFFITGLYTDLTRQVTDRGTIVGNPKKKMIVFKTDLDGNLTGKSQVLGQNLVSTGKKIITLGDGTAVAIGYVTTAGSDETDIYVVKLDANGVTTAEKIFKSPGNQLPTDILQTTEGFFVLGTTDVVRGSPDYYSGNADGKKDILLLRLDNNLETITTIPGKGFIGNDEGVAIKQDINGGFIVVGTTDRSDRPAAEQAGSNLIILKVNSDGSTTEPRIVGGTKNESASDFEVMNDGYLIAGSTGTEGVDQQGFIMKMPVNIYGSPEFESPITTGMGGNLNSTPTVVPFSIKAMCRYKSSSYLLAGQYGTGLSSQILIFSVDAFGTLVEGRRKIIGGTGAQAAYDITCNAEGDIVAVGSNSYENSSMITFLKFRF